MILFLFVPGFYASVEQSDHPELRGRPVLIGGDPRKRGTVNSVSVEAATSGSKLAASRLQRYRDRDEWLIRDRIESEELTSA